MSQTEINELAKGVIEHLDAMPDTPERRQHRTKMVLTSCRASAGTLTDEAAAYASIEQAAEFCI